MSKKSNRRNASVKRRVVRRSPVSDQSAKGRESRSWFLDILVAKSGSPTDQFLELLEAHRAGDLVNLSGMVDEADPSKTASDVERFVWVPSDLELVSVEGDLFMRLRGFADTNCADEMAALTGAIDGLSFRVLEGNLEADEELSDFIAYEHGRRIVPAAFN